jgi:hypothetical protein
VKEGIIPAKFGVEEGGVHSKLTETGTRPHGMG